MPEEMPRLPSLEDVMKSLENRTKAKSETRQDSYPLKVIRCPILERRYEKSWSARDATIHVTKNGVVCEKIDGYKFCRITGIRCPYVGTV